MKLTVGNSVYEMKSEQLKAVLHVASKQVPFGIYAVSKKGVAILLKEAYSTNEEAEVFELLVADKSLEEVSQRLLISKTTTSRRVADIKEKIERSQAMIDKVPIWEKVTLTIDEAAEYSNIGINRINDMLNNPSCPFVLFVGRGKRLVKRKEFEKYLEKTDSI